MSDYQLIQCSDDDLQELKRLALAARAASDDDEAFGLALDEYDEHANPDQVLCLFDEIDRITAEREALQLRLNAVDQRNDDLTELLNKALLAIKRTYQAGRDRIVDMGGDCDGVEYMMNSDLTVQEIRTALSPITQPTTVEEFSTCLECFGTGTVSVDIMSSKICNECGGTGKEQLAPAKSR